MIEDSVKREMLERSDLLRETNATFARVGHKSKGKKTDNGISGTRRI